MVAPISQIEVFSNASVLPNGKISLGVFPVNNNAQRSATLRGENSVKIVFNSGTSIPIPAFAFIEYDGQLFFTKEIYRPEPKGNNVYEYNVKFVSFDNLLSKPQAYRRVVVGSGAEQQTWNEPDIEIVGTLQTIAEVVCESIKASAVRYEGVFADLLSKVEIVSNEVSVNSESKAFSFQGQKISQVLESVANDYEIDYWFEQVGNMTNGITKMVLHFCKYERTDIDPLVLSDKTRVNRLNPYDPASPPNPRKPTVSGGLDECTFANEWSGVVQRITPFGSERNITRQQAILNEMFVSYGKRLRLEYDHSCTIDGTTYQHAYAIKKENGELEPLYVDENGAVYVPGVTTGEESIEKYDDIYPRGHFRVTHVTQRGVDTQIFTVYAIPTEERNGQYVDLTDAEIDAMQADPNKRLFPIDIQDGQTLSLHFESGFLNGREFEVANKSAKMVWTGDGYKVDPDNVNAHWIACFEINPEGDNNDSPQVPYGNMVPRGKLDVLGYEGDMFAIFNMDMPPYYKESAMNELAQKAYDEITAILSTRPEVKCKGNEEFFMRQNLCLGLRVKVTSDLFGEGTEFVSRVTNYSYQLSRPNKVDFRLCSSRVQGSISVLKGAIADQTQAVSGVQQTARSLSRRAFRDSQEMIGMLQAIVAEMMVVGVERNQFSFTMGIECLESAASPLTRKFSGLRITAGEIQHTQEPYIKDNWEGHYTVDATTLYVDKNNHSIGTDATEEIRNTPYYLYAVIQAETGKANMELWAEKKDGENDEAYLLLGILSSEFLDGTTSLRVFNRSNGFTQIAGGTITTEQLQDPTRQLIIDMSSNPPRIIAKRGAQIIGNITFISSEGTETNLATKIGTMDGDISTAKQNASDALEKANNIANDGIISGGTEKATIKKEWQEIAGDNMLGTVNGSYKKALDQATAYGLVVANNSDIKTAYNNLRNAMKTIIGFSMLQGWTDANMHKDTYLKNDDGSTPSYDQTVANYLAKKRSEFAELWRAYYDAEIALLNEVTNVADVGDNLIGAANPFVIPAASNNYNYRTLVGTWASTAHEIGTNPDNLEAGKTYTFALDKAEMLEGSDTKFTVCLYGLRSDDAYDEIYDADGNHIAKLLDIKDGRQTWTFTTPTVEWYKTGETTPHIGTEPYKAICLLIYAGQSGSTSGKSVRFTNLALYEGEYAAKEYKPYMRHLVEYFENAARDAETDVDGGLVATSLIKMRYWDGTYDDPPTNSKKHYVYLAGLSGLKDDNITLWGGGSYAQALQTLLGTASIPVLLTKDGAGSRIGCFRVVDSTKVQVVSALGKIVIDTAGGGITIYDANDKEKIVIVPSNINDAFGQMIILDKDIPQTLSKQHYPATLNTMYYDTIVTFDIQDSPNWVTANLKVEPSAHFSYQGTSQSIGIYVEVLLQKKNGNSWDTVETLNSGSASAQMDRYDHNNLSKVLNAYLNKTNLASGSYRIVVGAKGTSNVNLNTVYNSWYASTLRGECTPFIEPKTIIGLNGIVVANTFTRFFEIINNQGSQKILMRGLPDSDPSEAGQLYALSDNIVRISVG